MIRKLRKDFKVWRQRWQLFLLNEFTMRIPSHAWRRNALRRHLGSLGRKTSVLLRTSFLNPSLIRIGHHSVVNQKCLLDGRGGLSIGNNVDIAQETNIWTMGHDPHSDTHASTKGPVVIHDHVWIASRCTILPGVTLGQGCVVAAGSVVTKDVPPRKIVAGIPARVIGDRRSDLSYQLDYFPPLR